MDNIPHLREGICYKVGNPTLLHIWDDPWIPSLPGFSPPPTLREPDSPLLVLELISQDCWDMNILSATFPYLIIREILKIPLPSQREHDLPVWTPSPSGNFSIRSSYRISNQARFFSNSDLLRSVCAIFGMLTSILAINCSYGN